MDHKLEKFLAVVEAGGFTRAAKVIHVTQPALTIAVNQLEKEYGIKLLNRQQGSFGLTEAGKILYESTCYIRNEQCNVRQQLSGREQQTENVRFGILDTLATLLFASGQSTIETKGLEVRVDNSDRLIGGVQQGALDAGVITGDVSALPAGLEFLPLEDEQFVFVARADRIHEAKKRRISSWLAFNQDSHTYEHFVQLFGRLGIVAEPSFFSTSMDILKNMAISGQGIALLPQHFVRQDIIAGKLTAFVVEGLSRPIGCVMREGQQPNALIEDLTQELNYRLSLSAYRHLDLPLLTANYSNKIQELRKVALSPRIKLD